MNELTNAQKSYLRDLHELPIYRLNKRLRKINRQLVSVSGDTLLSVENDKLNWKRDMIISILLFYAERGYKQYNQHFKYEIPHISFDDKFW